MKLLCEELMSCSDVKNEDLAWASNVILFQQRAELNKFRRHMSL